GLLYFDADLDLDTAETSLSGILDGMGLAHILGRGNDELARVGPRYPLVRPERIVLFGFQEKTLRKDERQRLKVLVSPRFTLEEVAADPAGRTREALAELGTRCDAYVLHFDVDTIDYVDFPVGEVPHFDGLAYATALAC